MRHTELSRWQLSCAISSPPCHSRTSLRGTDTTASLQIRAQPLVVSVAERKDNSA